MYEIEIDDLWDCSHIFEGVGDVKQRNIVEHFQRRLLLRRGTNDEDCCTVVFTQAQEVHKYSASFLCDVSRWFQAALTNPGFESFHSKKVELQDTDPALFVSLMDLACDRQISSTEIPVQLCFLADQLLMVREVLSALRRAAFKSVKSYTCCEWMHHLGPVALLPEVYKMAFDRAVEHFEDVVRAGSGFGALELPTLEALLANDRLAVRDEDVVLRAVLRLPSAFQESLFRYIRWGVLRPSAERRSLENTYGKYDKAYKRRTGMDILWREFSRRSLWIPARMQVVVHKDVVSVTALCAGETSVFLGFEDGKVLEMDAHSGVEKVLESPTDAGHATCMVYMEPGVVFCGYNSGLLVALGRHSWRKLDDAWTSHIAVWGDHHIIYCTSNHSYKVYDYDTAACWRVGHEEGPAAAVETFCLALVVWGNYLFTTHKGSSIIYVYDLNTRKQITQITPESKEDNSDLLACDRRLLAVNTKAEITVWMLPSETMVSESCWKLEKVVSSLFQTFNGEPAEAANVQLTISGSKLLCSGGGSRICVLESQSLVDEENIGIQAAKMTSFTTVPGGNVWCIYGDEHYVGVWGEVVR